MIRLSFSHRTLLAALILIFLLVGVIALLRTPFAGWLDPSSSETRRPILVPGTDHAVTFTRDPGDDWMTQPQWGEPVRPVSLDVDLRSLPQVGPAEKTLNVEFEPAGMELPDPVFVDPILQETSALTAIPDPDADFAGLDLNNWGAGWPPDTNGDIGPEHYIQTVNTSIGIFSRSGTQLAAFTFDAFFAGTGTPCDANNNGDPVVLYDDVSGRWIITDFAWSNLQNGPYYECIAVSKTADPISGGWWFYGLQAHNSYLNDYPKLGVWHDGIYMTANLFDCLNASCSFAQFRGVRLWALNRDDLIVGNPLNYQFGDLGTAYASLLPAHARGSSMPAAGTPNYLGSLQSSSTLYTWKLSIDWVNVANSTLTGPFSTSVASYSNASSVPQPAGPNLDSLAGRLMAQFQYSEVSGVGALWATHSVSTSGRAAIRWYELRNLTGTPSVFQQGTFSPDATHRWMGSVGVDRDGNMAVVYSASSSSVHPQIQYTGRLVTETLGILGQGENTLIAGTGSQTSFNRWGDYSGMALDPLDECTFWFTTEYYISTGTDWQTRIGSFKFPSCTATPPDNASLSFVPGWNLITLPIEPLAVFTAQAFLDAVNGQGGSCNEIDRWLNGGWDGHVDGFPFNNFSLEMGVGYFVLCGATETMNYTGTIPSAGITVDLAPGWSLVGVPNPVGAYSAQTLLDAINGQGGSCSEIDRWLNSGWDGFVNGFPFNNFDIEPDEGYFVLCGSSGSFTP